LKANEINRLQNNDSIKNKFLLEIAYQAYRLNDSILFEITNTDAQLLSVKLKDTLGIADTHWNFGLVRAKSENLEEAFYHYFEAFKYFDAVKHNLFAGRMLYNLSIIQQDTRDYTGSEISIFQAIKKFNKNKHYDDLYRCYNNLGVINNKIGDYNKSILYHNEALKYLKKSKNKDSFIVTSNNNIGLVHQDQDNHDKAIEYFEKVMSNESFMKADFNLYARILDNITYSKFKNGTSFNIEQDFLKALAIRDSMKNVSGVVLSNLHIAEFYIEQGDIVKAISFTKEANRLAKTVDNHRDRLAALKYLSEIDKANADEYLTTYISLNDSLQIKDRAIRNKFTRIRYETDEFEYESERLATQNILISIIGTITVILITLLYFIKRQSAKNKELLFEKEQQKANQEIYELMLYQHHKTEEGRLEERNRISEDLHDGVLGKLFGTRVGLGFLDINGDKEQLEKYQFYLKQMQHIEKEIRDISHELKNEILSIKSDFASIIKDYIKPQGELHMFAYNVKSDDAIDWEAIQDKIKVCMYRIIQEAVQNIAKHAEADSIGINFYLIEETLNLIVVDDGLGFDTKKNKKGIGLKNMKSRVAKLNGTIEVDSIVDKGTTITVAFPLISV